MRRRDFRNVLLLGLMVGCVFGAVDLLMTRVHLREFVNLDYLDGTPLKMAVATALGAVTGAVGGAVGRLLRRA